PAALRPIPPALAAPPPASSPARPPPTPATPASPPAGYVIRDLAESLDRLDGPDPRRGKRSAQEELAARQVVESARHAPDLFSPPLVESMLEMAVDTAEPVVFTALTELSRAGKCPPRAAVEAALK